MAPELPSANQYVRVTVASGIGTIVIDRPDRRNALNLAVKREITAAVRKLSADPEVRILLLTGAGQYFVAGSDVSEMVDMTPADHVAFESNEVFKVLRSCPKISIAAVEGYALGGGCELAQCCDLIVAGDTALFGQPEICVGIMPGAGGTQSLVRAVGRYRALQLLLTGEHFSATDALNMGLVSQVVPAGTAHSSAVSLAEKILAMPPLAVSSIRSLVRQGPDLPLEDALALERQAFLRLFDSKDQKEGMRAFLEKRSPRYSGS